MASVKFPTFPSIDFSKLDIDRLPKFELPIFGTTKIRQIDIPRIGVPHIDTAAVTSAAKDAGYITVGLVVMAAQKAQVRRQEFRKSLNDQVGSTKSQLGEIFDAVEAGLAKVDSRLLAVEARVDEAVDGLEKRLPDRAGTLLGQAHEVVKVARRQVRTLVAPAS